MYDYDEMAATFKVRYMTSMEAYLRLYSYKIVQLSHQIYTLSVHDEGGQNIVIEEGHEERNTHKVKSDTKLMAFFNLCMGDPDARKLTYDQVPYYYWYAVLFFFCIFFGIFSWQPTTRTWKKRVYTLDEHPARAKMFVRVYTVSPKNHELFALRFL